MKGIVTDAEIKKFMKSVKLPFDDQESAMHYHDVHSGRYAVTLNSLFRVDFSEKPKVLELAASPYGMTSYLCKIFGENLTLASYSDNAISRDLTLMVGMESFTLQEFGFNVEHENWPIEPESFDLVIACEVVEHLAMDPMALFAGANRVLKPGGHLFVSTPNAASIQNFIKLARLMPAGIAQQFRRPFSLARMYERHNREYTPFTLGEMCAASGFSVELMETDSAFPLDSLGLEDEKIAQLLSIVEKPELRRDTINIACRKIGPVKNRYPCVHELYSAEDD